MPDLFEADIHAKVRQVRRRRLAQDLLNRLPACLAIGLAAATAWLLIQPFLPVGLSWSTLLLAALAVGAVLAMVLVVLGRDSAVGAALALDEAFDLKERVTTAVSLDGDLRQSPAGTALLEDVRQRVAGLDVSVRFPFEMPRRAWIAPAAAIAFAAVALFYHPGGGRPEELVENKDVKKDAKPPIDATALKKNQEKRRELARDLRSEKLEEIEADLEKLIQGLEKPEKQVDLKQTGQDLAKLNEAIKRRQDELSTARDIEKKLALSQELKKMQDGPASDLQKALADGNLERAKKELQKLAQQMKDGKFSEEQKKALAKQMNELAKKLDDVAEQKERKENLAKSDSDPESKAREMEKIERDGKKLETLKDLAQQLMECQQCLGEQALADAADALQDAMGTLEQMENYDVESELLKLTKEDLERLKKKMSGC